MVTNHEELLTLKQAAELVGTTDGTLRNAIMKGELKTTKLGFMHVVTAAAVTEWAKNKTFRPARQKKIGS